MRLIDADALLDDMKKELEKAVKEDLQKDECMVIMTSAIALKDFVNRQPTVEAKPVVHGEWKRVGSGSLYDTYECTNCHRPPKWDCLGDNHWRIAFTDICPHCGADMRGGKNE